MASSCSTPADLSEAALADRAVVSATVRHELGHLVGLDHTTDRTQLMFSETQPGISDYRTGDLKGLAIEGFAGVLPRGLNSRGHQSRAAYTSVQKSEMTAGSRTRWRTRRW